MSDRRHSDTLHRARRASWTALPPLAEPPPTVLDYLVERFPRVGRQVWLERMQRGLVHGVDGAHGDSVPQPISADTAFQPYLRVSYYREVAEQPKIAGRASIRFEDEHILVVDKPPFLPVTPSGPYVNECLIYRLEERLGLDTESGELASAHRLDRETRGLVLIVKSRQHRGAYARLFAEQQIHKTYQAWCHDRRAEDRSAAPPRRLEHRLDTGEPWFRMRVVRGEANAFTDVDLLERRGGFLRLDLRPLTGRQHQLRVQLADVGLPIVGDRFYPTLLPKIDDALRPPLQLLARELSFVDPLSGKPRHVVSEQGLESPEKLRLPE